MFTNTLNLPEPFVQAVTSDYVSTPRRYSATTILKGNKEIILSRRHADEVVEDVADYVWAIFGSAVHKILEQAQETDTQIKENFISYELPNGNTISGIFDLYDDSTGIVSDWKTVSVWKIIYNEWEDYRKQLLIYCLILRKMGFECKRGEIVALMKDWQQSKAKTDADYPQYPVYKIGWDFTDEELEDMEQYLIHKTDTIDSDLELEDDDIAHCTEEERWHKADTWAVTKVGNKRAKKVCESEEDALSAKTYYEDKDGKPYEIQFRKGEDPKCQNYCKCKEFCNYWKETYGN